jgi:thiol:disulfide interchange protein DsbD
MNNRHAIYRGKRLFGLAFLTGLLCLTVDSGAAVAQGPGEPILSSIPKSVHPGQAIELRIEIPLTPELHLYGPNVQDPYFATRAEMTKTAPINWKGGPAYPAIKSLKVFEETISVLEPDPETGGVLITFKGQVGKDAKPGDYPVEVKLTYQACSESACHSPIRNKPVSTLIHVVEGKPAATGASPTTKEAENLPATAPAAIPPVPPAKAKTAQEVETVVTGQPAAGEGEKSAVEDKETAETASDAHPTTLTDGLGTTVSLFAYRLDLKKAGLWIPLVIAFLAGLILNIMPCVLPVIPLKILQLAKQAHQEHHSPFRLSMIFASGIISFFMAVAVLALVLKGGFSWGQTFQNSTALIVLSIILVLLALGMFDVYQVLVPKFIANRSFVQKGSLGAFSMGFLAGVLSTPCSFGILGAAVTWAQSQAAWITVLGFLTIGLGMAFPYVLLSAFPKLLAKMPKTGRWSELFKQSMGFLLLAVAIFLISALPKDKILWTLLYMVLFAFVVWFWGVALEFKRTVWAKLARIAALAVLIVGGWGMLRSEPTPLKWQMLTPETYQQAQTSGKDVVVEFTADWCINCRTVEYLVFDNTKVKNMLKNREVVLLKGDLTEGDPFVKETLKKLTGTEAPPFTVVFKADNQKILLPGIYTTDDLIQAIQETRDSGRSTWNEVY